jgi:DNA-binding NarL/FixJ family response regulator
MAGSYPMPLRVLVVDGHGVFLPRATTCIGARRGTVVVGTARDCAQALELLREREVDLVVLDPMMSGGDGFRMIRAIKESRTPPLVVVTTLFGSSEARAAALAAGADGFIAKDDFAGGIDRLLGEILARRRAQVEDVTDPVR